MRGLDQTGGNLLLARQQAKEPRRHIAWQYVRLTEKKNSPTYHVGWYYWEGIESTAKDIFSIEVEGVEMINDFEQFDLLDHFWQKIIR